MIQIDMRDVEHFTDSFAKLVTNCFPSVDHRICNASCRRNVRD